MNDPLLNELIEIINAEIRAFHRLLELLEQEQRAIVADDLEGIEASVAEQQEVAVEAHRLEERRLRVVEELAGRLDLEPDNLSLGRLVEVVGGAHGEELARMRERMLELNRQIRATSDNNAFLIRQSLRYTERCLDILTGQDAAPGVYGKFGRTRRSSGDCSVLNQTA
jgi:flagellar biosynthesis/type III secretory pathway chaperone